MPVTHVSEVDEVVVLLREIRDELRALAGAVAAAVQRERMPRHLSPADEAALAVLLPVITTATAGRKFTVRELTEHSKLALAPAIALREALAFTTPRRIGRLLRRGCDIDVGGYRITAVDSTRDGVRWAVECDDRSSQKHAKFALPRRVRF